LVGVPTHAIPAIPAITIICEVPASENGILLSVVCVCVGVCVCVCVPISLYRSDAFTSPHTHPHTHPRTQVLRGTSAMRKEDLSVVQTLWQKTTGWCTRSLTDFLLRFTQVLNMSQICPNMSLICPNMSLICPNMFPLALHAGSCASVTSLCRARSLSHSLSPSLLLTRSLSLPRALNPAWPFHFFLFYDT